MQHTYSSISLSAKAGNDGYRHLHNLCPSLDRAGETFRLRENPAKRRLPFPCSKPATGFCHRSYANEFAYKPPLAHWLMAVASLPQGYVSEFTSRLPSALAFITLIGFTLVFFGKRLRFQQAFIATLLLITCIEIHRAAMTTRVDMLLTTFIVIGLYQLYRWEDKLELKGVPIAIPALLGCAVLTKGPVGIILPLFVFGVYLLMLRKYSYLVIFKALLYAGISSMFLPLLWYVAPGNRDGDAS